MHVHKKVLRIRYTLLYENKNLKNGFSIIAFNHLVCKCKILIGYLSVNSVLIFTENSTFIFSQNICCHL